MRKYWPLAVLVLAGLLFAANFHIFTGSRGMSIVPRVSPSLSEFIVNEDALRSRPGVFPLAAMALLADDKREIDKAREIVNR